ncbi:MAG TPA: cupin domain-containing protein [Terriglobia bacterium]|nr:cupin domain-containing protein [Terriglobia bacterium]
MMKRRVLITPVLIGLFLTFASAPVSPQTPKPQPLTLALQCPQGDCPLLKGAPQTAGMRSGYVRLNPGETVGWHTTGRNEESLIILRGHGEARLEGQPARPFSAPALVYIPPAMKHNVANTGNAILEYVYVVAPAQASQ